MDENIRTLENAAITGDEAAARRLVEARKRLGFDGALQAWVERFRGALTVHFADMIAKGFAGYGSVELEHGPKYVRVITGGEGHRSAYAFIEKATGNIFKPGGWKGPEPKKIIRGNIFNANPLDGCNPYGVAYANGRGGNFPWRAEAQDAAPVVLPAPPPEKKPDPVKCPEGAILRVRESWGPCKKLGKALEDKGTHFTYLDDETGRTKVAKKDTLPKYAGATPPRPHIEPCKDCLDHPESRRGPGYCSIHGSKVEPGRPCETCMST